MCKAEMTTKKDHQSDIWKKIFTILYKFSLNKNRLFTFERIYWNMCYQCVELVWGVFVLVSTARQPYPYSEWHISTKCSHSYCYIYLLGPTSFPHREIQYFLKVFEWQLEKTVWQSLTTILQRQSYLVA